jgi:hypothetical protein
MKGNSTLFKLFYGTMFFTACIPYIGYLFPFIPSQIFGFNQVGWAWIIMLLVTVFALLYTRKPGFKLVYWIPWILYLIIYLIVDFTFLGLQLTLQYLLPFMIGIVASGFVYNRGSLFSLYSSFNKYIIFIIAVTIFGYFFRPWLPAEAMVPMTLSLGAALYLAVYHEFKDRKYLLYFSLLFLIPLIAVTRMGLLVFLILFVFHFGENRLSRKIVYSAMVVVIGLLIFFSSAFQDKTFYNHKQGELSDVTIDMYEGGGSTFNSSGRSAYYDALKSGLEENAIFGNGPRSDNEKLKGFFKMNNGEAHNDYLSVRYNYGWVGLSLLVFGFIFQFILLYRQYKKEILWNHNILISAALVLHFGFWLFMYSDNILKYTIFFPNFFFAMVGIAYARYGRVKEI